MKKDHSKTGNKPYSGRIFDVIAVKLHKQNHKMRYVIQKNRRTKTIVVRPVHTLSEYWIVKLGLEQILKILQTILNALWEFLCHQARLSAPLWQDFATLLDDIMIFLKRMPASMFS